jgi:hypothetical protein
MHCRCDAVPLPCTRASRCMLCTATLSPAACEPQQLMGHDLAVSLPEALSMKTRSTTTSSSWHCTFRSSVLIAYVPSRCPATGASTPKSARADFRPSSNERQDANSVRLGSSSTGRMARRGPPVPGDYCSVFHSTMGVLPGQFIICGLDGARRSLGASLLAPPVP